MRDDGPPATPAAVMVPVPLFRRIDAVQVWVPVIVAVLSFNFLGDGLRDAADPYGRA